MILTLGVVPLAHAQDDEAAQVADPGAAQGAGPPEGVEVMRITGRKVTAMEAEVPSSVTQFDAATIAALGAQNISDLAKITPNVEIRNTGATAATFFIRGVGLSDYSANAAGAIAIYGDDVPFNAPALQLQGLFDLENVEVLRGPQGSGSGRNASGGAIKLHSRKPSGEIGGQLRASLGSYVSDDTRNALIQTYEGAIEIPIIEGMLASRFAFRFREADPFMENGCGDAPPIEDREAFPPRSDRDPRPKSAFSTCGDQDFVRTEKSKVPAGLPKHVGDQHNWAARGQFVFEPPVTDTRWLLNLHGSRLDQQSTLGQAMGTGNAGVDFLGETTASNYVEPDQRKEREDLQAEGRTLNEARLQLGENLAENRPLDRKPYRGDYNRVGDTTLDTWGGFLRGDLEIGPVSFTAVTGYDGYDRSRDTDSDFTPDVLFELLYDDKAWQVSEELRAEGEIGKSFRWDAGGFYLQENLKSDNLLLVRVLGATRQITRDYEQDLWSFGFWAGFSWDFLDDFTLEAGGRYNWEKKRFQIEEVPAIGATPPPADENDTWQAPTGTIALTYHFGEIGSVYWKYARGFKAGHFNSNGPEADPADSESIDSFETGLRFRWLENRVNLSGAFFYYKYKDYQVFVFEDNPGVPPTLEIINASDAQQYGVELEGNLFPIQGSVPDSFDDLQLTVRFGWLESEFLDFSDTVLRPQADGTQIPVNVDFTGNPLINAPEFKVSGTVEWPFELGYWGTITPRYDFTWSDDIFFNSARGRGIPNIDGEPRLPEYSVGQKAFALHNLLLSYRTPEGNIEISAWVRNLTDERYKSYAFDASQFSRVVISFVGEPRTVGADIAIRW